MDILSALSVIFSFPEGRSPTVRKTSVEINEELLVAVQRVLSTATIKDTIEEAFREILRAEARREEVEALATLGGLDLSDSTIMAGAWRP
jgi:Arc/MetJ family transcription regulator